MAGILGYGCYIPRLRLSKASIAAAHAWFAPGLKALEKGSRPIGNWDEDCITMAVEAARGCLNAADGRLDAIYLASTSLPFIDRQNAGIVKEALALDDAISTLDFTGSQRAGSSALLAALKSAPVCNTLCIAAEKSRPQPGSESELTAADAACAFLTGAGEVIAELLASVSLSIDFVDHYKAAGAEFSYGWESRWLRDEGYGKIIPRAVNNALAASGLRAEDIAHFAFAPVMKGVAASVANRLGIPANAIDAGLAISLGDSGTAQPYIALAQALEKATPGALILAIGFGQGCDVLIFRATPLISAYRSTAPLSMALAQAEPTSNYLKYLALNGLLNIDRGMRAEQDQKTPLTALYRERRAVMGLIGGRCPETGTVQFPKSDITVNPNGGAYNTQEDYPFADRIAKILTYTADRLAYTPAPPYCYGMIGFEGGGRMVAEFTDCNEADIDVGIPVRMVFRIKNFDDFRHFKRYFWKAIPVRQSDWSKA